MDNILFELIKDLSLTVFSEEARRCDAANVFPEKNFQKIKEHNLLALLIPQEYGGFGLNFLEYQKCLVEIAKGCAATASAFNMHNIVVGSLVGIKIAEFTDFQRERILPFIEYMFDLVVNQKAVFAAATTELGIGARFSQVKTNFSRTSNGYILNGKKSFVTMAEYADYYIVLANQLEKLGSSDHSGLTYFIVSRQAPGVSIVKTWDTLGMRATSSQEVIFSNVELSAQSVFMGREGFALNKVMREPHWITGGYLGVYLGVMEAAYAFACAFLKERSNYTELTGLAFQPLIQARLGEMFSLLHNARLAVFAAASAVDLAPGEENTNQAIFAAKYIVGETAHQLTGLAIKICGGSSIHKRYDLERHHRDSCCCALMPAVSDMCQIYLGKAALNINEKSIW
jgi:alkylation response protein AidB-like acyl-CoA dehydrogenase